jgi:lathosterol oxidase
MFLEVLKVTLIIFALVSLRYLLIPGSAYLFFWKWKKENFQSLRIQPTFPSEKKIRNEVKWSFVTFTIFALVGTLVHYAGKSGFTLMYRDINDYGLAYFIFSVFLMLLIHDTYFYWMHRFMHLKPVFKYVHKIHHESTNPSPMAAFSFHPIEAILEAMIVPIIIMIIPVHMAAIFLFLVCMTIINAMGHLGYELYPQGFTRHPILKYNNTSTHHNMHHKYFNSNYGLYLNVWDTLMNTNQQNYHETFENIKEKEVKQNKDNVLNRKFV